MSHLLRRSRCIFVQTLIHMNRTVTFLLAIIATTCGASAKAPEDNVFITSAHDEFVFTDGRDGPEVKHTRRVEYTATRHSATVYPHIFYNDKIRLDKASGGKMEYRDANSPTVFHDGSKVCSFRMDLTGAGKKGRAEFRRTFTDAAHFTGVFPEESYPVREKTLIFRLPPSMNRVQLVDEHFPATGIARTDTENPDGSRTIVYTVSNLAEAPDDESAPSALSSRPYIAVRGYFENTDAFFAYHRNLFDVDTSLSGVEGLPAPDASVGRLATIQQLYDFVRDNIRYVAYEEGDAAFRPDTPAETMRKRYGDCKSMSLLFATLLNRAGIQAYFAVTGTRKIPWRIAEYPSLAAANHAICVVPEGDGYLFLDPTQPQISASHIPGWLRGKDAMALTGDGYRMIDIPAESPCASEDIITYDYVLCNDGLAGRIERRATEDVASDIVAECNGIGGRHLSSVLALALAPAQGVAVVADSLIYDKSKPGCVTMSVPVINGQAVTEYDGKVYVGLNAQCSPYDARMDLSDRREDLHQPLVAVIRRVSRVQIPSGCKVTLPDDYSADYPWGTLSCRFEKAPGMVMMTKTMELKGRDVPLSELKARNEAIARWNEVCNQQIEIQL